MAEVEEVRVKEKKPKKEKRTVEEETHEEKVVFDPRAGLSADQLGLRDQLEALAFEYAQDDREKAWLSDMCLFRYLRARDWKLEKAEKMLKATMDWRREWKVDDIKREDVILTLDLRSLYRNGVDKSGRPIMFIKPSYNPNTVEYRLKSLIYSLEETIESMDSSAGIEKMCLIADFEVESKLQKKSPDQTTVARNFLSFLQNHYPERLGICFALNPPWYIRVLYTIISPFMDPVTKKKIHFVNGDHAHIKKELLQYIDEDQLEKHYGGSRKGEPEDDIRHARQEREAAASTAASSSTQTDEGTPKPKKKKKKPVIEEAEIQAEDEALANGTDEVPVKTGKSSRGKEEASTPSQGDEDAADAEEIADAVTSPSNTKTSKRSKKKVKEEEEEVA